MLLSHQNKYIFIHIYKTAGTSIVQALEQHGFVSPFHRFFDNFVKKKGANLCAVPYSANSREFISYAEYEKRPGYSERINKANRFLNAIQLRWQIVPSHIRANELKRQFPLEICDSYFKFAFVRNSWDWQVSLYHFICKTKTHAYHPVVSQLSGFEEYLEWRISEDVKLQKDFVTDSEGRLIVDFVGRFENLLEDFDYICQIIGIKANLPHLNQTKHDSYKHYYNSRTRELVAHHFAPDIELFQFSFDA